MFAQMASPQLAPPDWEPAFGDYLYLSFTNAAAFSPTDVLRCPLGQDGHDRPGQGLDRDRRVGRGPRRQHPQVALGRRAGARR